MSRKELDLREQQQGTSFGITLKDSQRYDLHIIKDGEQPLCLMTQTYPEGQTRPTKVILEGAGFWTTPEENPIQNQQKAMSIAYGRVIEGGYIVVSHPTQRRRIYLVPEVQKLLLPTSTP